MEAARKMEQPLVFIFLDIDHFLEVNQSLGHMAGDGVLATVAETMRQTFGETAILGRYGGDKFVILLPSVEREAAFLALEKLRQAVEARSTYEYEGKSWQIQVTISAGLAAFPIDGRSGYELLRKADQALYRAKAARNQVRLAIEEKLAPKTSHYTQTQLERLTQLAQGQGFTEAELLREAMDDLLIKYGVNDILS
ncbi:MAG: GGDEF domain-containing protein [Chloroflexota bacterium]